jgi:hypothetical protein
MVDDNMSGLSEKEKTKAKTATMTKTTTKTTTKTKTNHKGKDKQLFVRHWREGKGHTGYQASV